MPTTASPCRAMQTRDCRRLGLEDAWGSVQQSAPLRITRGIHQPTTKDHHNDQNTERP